jgi:hypothetical protein
VKVTAVTPSDAAADPNHPDHDRWVKETTLKVEAEHAKRVGLTYRDAEAANAYWLQRAEAKAREKPDPAPVSKNQRKAGRKTREERLAERPVAVKRAVKEKRVTNADLSPCGRCGLCRGCKREKRIYAMIVRAKREGDTKIQEVIKNLWLTAMQARDRTGPFAGLSVRDANRIITRQLEDLCDSTIPKMGDWK